MILKTESDLKARSGHAALEVVPGKQVQGLEGGRPEGWTVNTKKSSQGDSSQVNSVGCYWTFQTI